MPIPSSYAVPGPESVDDLVNRIADRDRAAFRRFCRRLVRPVFPQVRESLGSSVLAVAVTRAVFVEVWLLAPVSASREIDALAWVTDIAARRAADRLREIEAPMPGISTGHESLLSRELAIALGTEPLVQLGALPGTSQVDGLPSTGPAPIRRCRS